MERVPEPSAVDSSLGEMIVQFVAAVNERIGPLRDFASVDTERQDRDALHSMQACSVAS